MTDKNASAPSIFVILGVTGDLSIKKIIPSLWLLFKESRLSSQFKVIGLARRELTNEQFAQFIQDTLQKKEGHELDKQQLASFQSTFTYISGDFDSDPAYQQLAETTHNIEKDWGVCANKLLYLSVPPNHYTRIFEGLASVKLNEPCGGELGWSRILIEKPFGTDYESAQQLQNTLSQYFKEEQIYRIDHYLFKEVVQGIESFRFSNNLFEDNWDNSSIESVHIRLNETVGAEDRGPFYDKVGALRDVGQNHLLTILALLTMDYPAQDSDTALQNSRAQILNTLQPWDDNLLAKKTFRAQYNGFQNIEGVQENTHTETFFALQTQLNHPKWQGVPITIEAGKQLAEVKKEVVITLKHGSVCHLCEIDENHQPNQIIFQIAPNDEVKISFWTKKPGFENKIEQRQFSFFVYEKETKAQYVEEYAKVLYWAVQGDKSLFVCANEINAQWRFVDPIVKAWQENKVPLNKYDKGTTPSFNFEQELKPQIERSIGVVGLGKMGANLARQLMDKGWQVTGYNRSPEIVKELEQAGMVGATDLADLVAKLPTPKLIWLMVPHQAVNDVIAQLEPHLNEGDVVIDGGNSPYKQSMANAEKLRDKEVQFLDVGVSGGPEGARNGACLMIGGNQEIFEKYENLFRDIAVKEGYAYLGSSGAGHFVKMVHNGIEYGMMQAIGEGFEVMKRSQFALSLGTIAHLYNHGSVITSSLIGWLSSAYYKFSDDLNNEECCSGSVAQSGEGLWTVETAKELGVPVPIIEGSVEFRKQSQDNPSYTGQVLSALRHEFGGHEAKKKNEK